MLQVHSTVREESGMSSPVRWALLSVLAILGVQWAIFNLHEPLGLWEAPGDYPQLSLAHALNVDYFTREQKERVVSQFQYCHPGIPFQLASWVAYKGSRTIGSAEADVHSGVVDSPGSFLLCSRILLLALIAFALWLLRKELAGITFWPAVAVYCSFLCYWPAWEFSLVTLGNESFALLGCVLFFGQAKRALAEIYFSATRWVLLGATAGCAYLIKLNYVTLLLALLLVLIAAGVFRVLSFAEIAKRSAASLAGFIGGVLLIGACWLGPQGLKQMGAFHWQVATHSGLYGQGAEQSVVLSTCSETLRLLLSDANYGFFLGMLAAVLGVVLGVVGLRHREESWMRETGLLGLLLGMAGTGFVAAAVKHWQPHYLIPAAAVLPLALAWVLREIQKRYQIILTSAILATALLAGVQCWSYHFNEQRTQAGWREDARQVREIPLARGEVRLWTYGVLVREQTLPMMLSFSGRPDAERIERDALPQDRVYNIWNQMILDGGWKPLAEVKWRTAAFSRKYFPDRGKLPPAFLASNCEVIETPRMFLIVRSGSLGAEPIRDTARVSPP